MLISRALLASALLLTACTGIPTTSDDGAADAQVAILSHRDPAHSIIRLVAIDGRAPDHGRAIYRLTPGTHSVEVVPVPSNTNHARVTRWFDVIPGGRYELDARIDTETNRWGFWVLDLQTRRRIDRAAQVVDP